MFDLLTVTWAIVLAGLVGLVVRIYAVVWRHSIVFRAKYREEFMSKAAELLADERLPSRLVTQIEKYQRYIDNALVMKLIIRDVASGEFFRDDATDTEHSRTVSSLPADLRRTWREMFYYYLMALTATVPVRGMWARERILEHISPPSSKSNGDDAAPIATKIQRFIKTREEVAHPA